MLNGRFLGALAARARGLLLGAAVRVPDARAAGREHPRAVTGTARSRSPLVSDRVARVGERLVVLRRRRGDRPLRSGSVRARSGARVLRGDRAARDARRARASRGRGSTGSGSCCGRPRCSAPSFATFDVAHPAQNLGWLAWPVVVARDALVPARPRGALPAPAPRCCTRRPTGSRACCSCGRRIGWWIASRTESGPRPRRSRWAPALVLATLRLRERVAWPFAAHAATYVKLCCGGALAALMLATIFGNAVSPGDSAPLPYVPLLNPLELVSVLVCVVLLHWLAIVERSVPALGLEARHRAIVAAAVRLVSAHDDRGARGASLGRRAVRARQPRGVDDVPERAVDRLGRHGAHGDGGRRAQRSGASSGSRARR